MRRLSARVPKAWSCARFILACGLSGLAASVSLPATALAAERVYWTTDNGSTISFANLDASGAGNVSVSGATVSGPQGIVLDPAAGRMYWANFFGNKVSFANLDGSGGGDLTTTAATVNGPSGVMLDTASGRIYWANISGNKISYANLDGSGGGDLNTSGATVDGPSGVAIDPIARRIYWAGLNKISYANLDGSGGGDLNTSGATVAFAEGVAVDPAAGRIYWASVGNGSPGNGKISYANLNGTGGGDLTTTGATVYSPNGVAVDHSAGRIYWANRGDGTANTARISLANLDGSGGGDLPTIGANMQAPGFPALLRVPLGAGLPVVTGGSGVGTELDCSRGSWAPDLLSGFFFRAPGGFAFQWRRDGADVPGAGSSSFTPGAPGAYSCRVTATNTAGSAAQTSAPHTVAAGSSAPAKASFAGSKSTIRLDRRRRFSFKFRAGPGLHGSAVFKTAKRVRVSRKRKLTLAKKAFKVPASGRVTLKLRLSRTNFRVLKLNGKLPSRVTITLKDAAGLTSTASKAITLKQPKRPRH